MKLAIVMLAAGQGSRFNGIKQLANINGELLVNRQIVFYQSFKVPIYLVLGAHQEEIIKYIEPDLLSKITIVESQNWQSGMSASIASGIHLAEQKACSHILLTLLDQVCIEHTDIKKLLNTLNENTQIPVASCYQETVGAPAIIPACYFADMKALTGDKGAKKILEKYAIKVEMPSAVFDIDTQEQLTTLRKALC